MRIDPRLDLRNGSFAQAHDPVQFTGRSERTSLLTVLMDSTRQRLTNARQYAKLRPLASIDRNPTIKRPVRGKIDRDPSPMADRPDGCDQGQPPSQEQRQDNRSLVLRAQSPRANPIISRPDQSLFQPPPKTPDGSPRITHAVRPSHEHHLRRQRIPMTTQSKRAPLISLINSALLLNFANCLVNCSMASTWCIVARVRRNIVTACSVSRSCSNSSRRVPD